MSKWWIITCMAALSAIAIQFTNDPLEAKRLRRIYSRPPSTWPAPLVSPGVEWTELGQLLPPPIGKDSAVHLVELGKQLFFDPRLSGSLTISCATCHAPELSWTDGRTRSLGHGGAVNKRNSPSLHNVWYYDRLFWDGRSRDLEDQAFGPINSESEMHGDMSGLPRRLRGIAKYPILFEKAYGDAGIDPDRIAGALAAFQRTISSNRSPFDNFLAGDSRVLTDPQLRGLHIFRTKAGCMNCHHGPMFTDNSFHNNGFAGNDKGYYFVSHDEKDMGKMKTPSLRDVLNTGPWMHDGSAVLLERVIDHYNLGGRNEGQDPLIRELHLTAAEKTDLLAFLAAISAPPVKFSRPVD